MRRHLSFRFLLLCGFILIAGIAGIGDACFRCRQVCIVYVTQQGGGGPPPVPRESNRIRAIIIGDTNDAKTKGWNTAINSAVGEISTLLNIMNKTGQFPDPRILAGTEVTRQNILNTISSIAAGPNDTLFVYYNGHGAAKAKDKEDKDSQDDQKRHFFRLLLEPDAPLYRTEILEAMKARGCRLNILISDSCFSPQDAGKPGELTGPTTFFSGESTSAAETNNIEIFRHLFLQNVGTVDINSCQLDENAMAGVFTPILVKEARKFDATLDPTWEQFFKVVQKKTKAEATKKIDEYTENGYSLGALAPGQKTQTPRAFVLDAKDAPLLAEEPTEPSTQTGSSSTAQPAPATVQVQVPPDAKLFIDDRPTKQVGALRTFHTPELSPGSSYSYTIRVEVSVDGTTKQVNREVSVEAGKTVSVDLSSRALFQPAIVSVTASGAQVALGRE